MGRPLAPSGKLEDYELNCAAAHPIAPGEEPRVRDGTARAEERPGARERPLLGQGRWVVF